MAIDAVEQGRDFCSVLVITDEETGSVQCEPSLALSTYLAVQGSQLYLDAKVTGQKPPELSKGNAETYSPSTADLDIEKGKLDKPLMKDETGATMKAEIALTKPLRRQNSLQPGGEPIRPLMNQILMLLKLDEKGSHDEKDKQTAERAHEVPNNRWRKCKRPTAFDSRQIVLLFSILSSMGTIVLIYLTLRVRQASEGFVQI